MKSLRLYRGLRAGDLVGFSGYDLVSALVNIGSCAVPFFGLSHIGILAEYKGELLIFESTTLCKQPCFVALKPVSGTQCHRLPERVQAYNGKVFHYPLACPLSYLRKQALTDFLMSEIGRPYDMAGAICSGGRLFAKFQAMLFGENQKHLFCSEWCAAAHRQVHVFNTINASKWSPNALIAAEYEQGCLLNRRRLK